MGVTTKRDDQSEEMNKYRTPVSAETLAKWRLLADKVRAQSARLWAESQKLRERREVIEKS